MCIETALKKVSSSLKDVIPIPSCNLDIYRWADLALSTDHEEPVLAVIWQNFFVQFLHRVTAGPGLPERGSVGSRFFESTANTTYLKNTSNSLRLFQTLALWLDEPRLHSPTLFLQGLPPVYDADRLTKVLRRDEILWLDSVDLAMIDWQLNASLQFWMRFNKERQKKICTIQKRNLIKKPERVAHKTFGREEMIEPPLFNVLSTPIPECPVSVLLDKYKIMETLGRNLDVLADYARKFMMKLSTNSALDYEYMDMLKHLYENTETQLQMSIPCHKKGTTKKGCQGPANLVVKYREKKSCDPVRDRASRNREEFKMLMREMLHQMPPDICLNALCVEKTLTLLLKQWKSCQNPAFSKKFEDIGCSTFYMFIDMVSDSVRQFPPTMQFFSTCVELLGKTFIMENRTQTEVLLRTILARPKIVGLLLPIFQPSTCEDSFTEMYENVIQTNLDVEVKFSLLSKLCSLVESCRGFLIEIFPRIPWVEVLQHFRLVEGATALKQFQNLLFNLLLVLGNEKSIIKIEECEMLTLVGKAVELDWDLLDGTTFRSVCDWLVSNCNYVEVLKPSSVIWNSIRLLQAACLLSSLVTSEYTYTNIPEKRLHYLNSMVKLLCKCSASPEHTPGLYRPVIEQLMDSVLVASTSDATTNNQNITFLYMEVLNLLNSLSPTEKVLVLALETIQEKIRDLTQTNVILAMIVAACRSLASINLMVQVVEVAVETHFNNIKLPSIGEGNESQEGLVDPWTDVFASVTVPELSQREFVQECINHNAVLTLFTHTVQYLSQCQSAAAELIMLKDLTAWTASIKPSNPDTESKVILLWYKILQLIVRQISYDVNLRDLGQQVDFLIPYITHAGEDRDTTGLLGVIGFGRKSPLTASFRFLCRALSTFLSAQLPTNGLPRVKTNAPGCPKAGAKKETTSGPVATQRTNTAFHNLESLRLNKTYLSLVEHIEYACKYIINPEHCLCDGPRFLEKLSQDLFKDKSYLVLAV
ncbi:Hypothetical predicted protein [Paramuricea clavata]|nr:Hypothetical predicted protein [Paramuricea clavata]